MLIIARALSALGGDFQFDLNSGVPPGTKLNGSAHWSGTGGIGNSGVVKLTTAGGGQGGEFELPDLEPGRLITAFTLSAKVFIGGGSSPPADGFYIAVTPTPGDFGGLFLEFDSYDNGGNEAPAIDVFWKGISLGRVHTGISQGPGGNSFFDVSVKLDADGTLDLSYNNTSIYSNLATPYFPQAGAKFRFAAQTGGLYDNHWVDNVDISTTLVPMTPFQEWYDSFMPGKGGTADPNADYNGNGWSNFLEFAFAMDLLTGGGISNLPKMEGSDIVIYKRRAVGGLRFDFELASTVRTTEWITGVAGIDYTENVTAASGVEIVRVHILNPRPLKPRFFRVRASSLP
ncbi:MAG TPA: hypothetical protein VG796_07050 [Verrucomicrobiales bacterium]|nr:hypothetical protein [Verrucomicrobiales bacterium]